MIVLILGGYGVFGGRLARLLLSEGFEVIVAGRDAARAAAFCEAFGGRPVTVDRGDAAALAAVLAKLQPAVVVDAAGPFQFYGTEPYAAARAVLAAGAHYLDLSDDAGFTAGIAALNADASARGLTALSGVASVPALSSAAVADLARPLAEIGLIETAILPGNRAPRGMAVMQAILTQAGAPLRVWRGGRWREVPGWSGRMRVTLAPGLTRVAALIGAPDLALFPARFRARSVLFRAGLELPLLHEGLRVLAWLRRIGALPDLARFARPLRALADLFRNAGSDRGGMRVSVLGRTPGGTALARHWTLLAEAGEGPFIPAIPAYLLIQQLAQGGVAAGARPAIAAFTLEAAETAMSRLAVVTRQDQAPAPRLFEAALRAGWEALPAPLRALHDVWDLNVACGTASVLRGQTLAARLVAWLFRFPKTAAAVPVRVTMQRVDAAEHWRRDFGGTRFASVLSAAGPGQVYERFGPFKFLLGLEPDPGGLGMPVRRGWCLGLPIPRWALPVSETREFVAQDRFHFDVRLSLPLVGLLVWYRGDLALDGGHLEPDPRPAL